MAETTEFELVSPAKLLKSEPVEMVVVPGAEGDVGVLPGHSPLIASLRPGTIDIHQGGKVVESLFVAGGFVEVSETRCTVLADDATPVAQLNKASADAELAEAKAALDKADDGAKAAAEKAVKIAEAKVLAAS
ncbi:MAG: ATP synthase F1 subunit epsilon [Rhodospirillales bacterium]